MKKKDHQFYVCSARYDGRGRGFALGFHDRKAADVFAGIVLFGFAEVLPWWEFEEKFGNFKS